MRVHACACVCVCVCVRARACVRGGEQMTRNVTEERAAREGLVTRIRDCEELTQQMERKVRPCACVPVSVFVSVSVCVFAR